MSAKGLFSAYPRYPRYPRGDHREPSPGYPRYPRGIGGLRGGLSRRG